MNSICTVAVLKVQCKQRYRLLKIRKFNAYKNDSIGSTAGFKTSLSHTFASTLPPEYAGKGMRIFLQHVECVMFTQLSGRL